MIRILTCTHIGQYEQEMYSRGADYSMVDSVDIFLGYSIGDIYYYSGIMAYHFKEVIR